MINKQHIQKVVDFYIHAIRINDRTTRADYFGFNLLSVGLLLLGWIFASIPGIEFFLSLAAIILFLPTLAVGVRRLKDSNRSGIYVLWSLIPIIGWLVMLYFSVQKGTKGSNKYGKDPRIGRTSLFTLYDGDLFKKS